MQGTEAVNTETKKTLPHRDPILLPLQQCTTHTFNKTSKTCMERKH